MKVYCVFALESPHQGDSNENAPYNIFNMNKKNTLNYPKSVAKGFFAKGLRNEFETAVVNEPSVFEPLKFYCIYMYYAMYYSSERKSICLKTIYTQLLDIKS